MLRRRHMLLSAVWCHLDTWRLWMAPNRGMPFYIVVHFPRHREEQDYRVYMARCNAMAERIARGRGPRRYDGKAIR